MADYSFGDSDLAEQRLAHVARAFDAPSRAFLAEWGFSGCALAVDLGCGPGHTTQLLREVLAYDRALGLDASPAFIEAARRGPCEGVEFREHDAMYAWGWTVATRRRCSLSTCGSSERTRT